MNKIKKTLAILLITVSGLLAGISLLAYVCHINRFTELLSGLRLSYFLLGLIFLIPALIGAIRHSCSVVKWLPVLLISLSLIINGVEILPYYLPSPNQSGSIGGHKLKVMLFNVLHQNRHFPEVINLVQDEQPDIAVFLEATDPWPEKLALLSPDYPYHEAVPQVQFEIYSKLPITREKTILYGSYRGFVPLVVKLAEDVEVMLVASHAYPPRYFGPQGFELRNTQITKGIPEIASGTKLPLIILGDFNMDMWSGDFKKMIGTSGLHNVRKGFGVLPSLWIGSKLPLHSLLGLPVDHCLVDKNIAVHAAYSGPHTGSDHLPMFFILDVPAPSKTE